jgi:hypothetical protein
MVARYNSQHCTTVTAQNPWHNVKIRNQLSPSRI